MKAFIDHSQLGSRIVSTGGIIGAAL